jgi:hypothetical protein
LKREFRNLAAVDVFERNLVNVVDGPRLLWASISHPTTEHAAKGTAAAKELGEQVLRVHSTTGTAVLEAFFAILVIYLAFLRVGEDFVSVRQIFELLRSLRVVSILVCEAEKMERSARGIVVVLVGPIGISDKRGASPYLDDA